MAELIKHKGGEEDEAFYVLSSNTVQLIIEQYLQLQSYNSNWKTSQQK